MKKGLMTTVLCMLCIIVQAQAPSISYEYELITTADIEPGRSDEAPYSILMSPDRKYLISRSLKKTTPFRIYNVETGEWKDTKKATTRFSIDSYHFESDSMVYIFIARKVFQIDLTTATLTTHGWKSIDDSIYEQISSDTHSPSTIWRGARADVNLPGRFEVRQRQNKAYLYYIKR